MVLETAVAVAAADATRTVSAGMVHKHKAENVWISDPEVLSDASVRFAYDVPMRGIGVRLAELVEVERQAGIYFSHAGLGVPEGDVFVLSSISIRALTDVRSDVPIGSRGFIVVRTGDVGQASRQAGTELTFRLETDTGGAAGSARVRFLPTRVYERLRASSARALTSDVPPIRGVRIGSEGLCEGIVAPDPEDPVLSDHAADHVSAMTVIVSVEQGLIGLGAARLDAIAVEFHSYLEPDVRAVYGLALTSDGAFSGSVQQNGASCATFTGLASLANIENN